MKQITVDIFKFDELSEKAKEKALEKFYDINIDNEWWEWTYSDAEEIGLKITGFELDRKNITGEFITSAGEVVETILSDHGADCETYKTALRYKNAFQLNSDETDEEELSNTEDEFLNDILEDYRIILQKEFDYQTSEEAIKETIEANDYEFTADGKLSKF